MREVHMEKCSNNQDGSCKIFAICRNGGWRKKEVTSEDVKTIIYQAAAAFYPRTHDYNFSNFADMFRDGRKLQNEGVKVCFAFSPPYLDAHLPTAEDLVV